MSLTRRWVVTCDEPGCDAVLVVPKEALGSLGDDKADAGVYANDQDWAAAPGRASTFCPKHPPDWWLEDDPARDGAANPRTT